LESTDYYLIDVYNRKYLNEVKYNWEQTREIAYMIAQVNSRKQLKKSDILKFSWDSEVEKKNKETVTAEKKAEIMQQMREFEKKFNNKIETDGRHKSLTGDESLLIILDNLSSKKLQYTLVKNQLELGSGE
jgi:hypothetical protein